VHRWEFDLWREGWEHRIRELERLHDGHEEGHDERHEQSEHGSVSRAGERRRWSVPEIVVASITAAGVIAAAAITALGK
jgi:hypothetical protein